jgi:hypothetical protein
MAKTPTAIFNDELFEIPAIQELIKYDQWVIWCWKERTKDGETTFTKPPYQARQDKKISASVTDRKTWASFAEAITAFNKAPKSWKCAGIGFVVSDDDPFGGVDLDHCFTEGDHEIEPWAKKVIEKVSTYTELSPSGSGLRAILRGTLNPDGRKRKGRLEVYCTARYYTITGIHLEGAPLTIEDRQKEYLEIQPKDDTPKVETGAAIPEGDKPKLQPLTAALAAYIAPDSMAPESKLDALRANVPEFKRVWERTVKKDGWSDSEWDLSLTNYMLAALWSYPEITEALIEHRRTHGIKAKLRADYYARTIIRGLQDNASMEARTRLASTEIDEIEDPEQRREQILDDISLSLWPDGYAKIADFNHNLGDPPSYTVVTSVRSFMLTSEDLHKPHIFASRASSAASRVPKQLKKPDHLDMVNRLYQIESIRDIGDEATHAGQALAWLDDYLDGVKGNIPADGRERKQAMLEGSPILHGGHLRITGDDMVQWLQRHRSVRVNMRTLGPMLRAAGLWIKSTPYTSEEGLNTSKSLWCVPDEIARDHGIKVKGKT